MPEKILCDEKIVTGDDNFCTHKVNFNHEKREIRETSDQMPVSSVQIRYAVGANYVRSHLRVCVYEMPKQQTALARVCVPYLVSP